MDTAESQNLCMCRSFKRENREWERSGHGVPGGEPREG
jgi:hypothetical protein